MVPSFMVWSMFEPPSMPWFQTQAVYRYVVPPRSLTDWP